MLVKAVIAVAASSRLSWLNAATASCLKVSLYTAYSGQCQLNGMIQLWLLASFRCYTAVMAFQMLCSCHFVRCVEAVMACQIYAAVIRVN